MQNVITKKGVLNALGGSFISACVPIIIDNESVTLENGCVCCANQIIEIYMQGSASDGSWNPSAAHYLVFITNLPGNSADPRHLLPHIMARTVEKVDATHQLPLENMRVLFWRDATRHFPQRVVEWRPNRETTCDSKAWSYDDFLKVDAIDLLDRLEQEPVDRPLGTDHVRRAGLAAG